MHRHDVSPTWQYIQEYSPKRGLLEASLPPRSYAFLSLSHGAKGNGKKWLTPLWEAAVLLWGKKERGHIILEYNIIFSNGRNHQEISQNN
jgi:hypothetical protein